MSLLPISALFLFPVILILTELGRRWRLHRKIVSTSSTVEGAVFALFGLLLAFTFSGAMTRYDAHRSLLVQETNDISTAYLRLDLLAPDSQAALRQLFRDYTTSRLHLYDTVRAGNLYGNLQAPATDMAAGNSRRGCSRSQSRCDQAVAAGHQ